MQNKVKSQRFIWIDIMLTLIALIIMGYFYYGIRAVFLCGVCATSSLAAEMISLRLMKRKFTADDLTCISDALILSLMLPAVMDYTIAAIACGFAVTVKNIFGGRKNIVFSPAAAGYVFLLTSWKSSVLMFTEPHVHTGLFEKATELVSSASHNFNTTGRMDYTDFEILMGNISGPTGAVSILLLAVAALVLILRRDISFGAFIGMLMGTSLLSFTVPMCSGLLDSVKYTFSTNMVLFAAVYIVSDKRVAPERNYFSFFYGIFISLFSYILIITTAAENAIVIASILFTPVSLGFKNLERYIARLEAEEEAAVRRNLEIYFEKCRQKYRSAERLNNDE